MQTQTQLEQDRLVEEKVQKVKELYADAPELGRIALEKGLPNLTREFAEATGTQNAGRIGARQGKVSELTGIFPFVEGGAKRLRGLLELLEGNFKLADAMGTVHDMRFVFLDNDTKLLFCTAYDGEWDAYIDDFATKIPDFLDIIDSAWEGWPGKRSPEAKDYLAKYQISAEGWYVANDLTVAETRRLRRLGEAVDELLDKIGG
jgi:hypothetical protein